MLFKLIISFFFLTAASAAPSFVTRENVKDRIYQGANFETGTVQGYLWFLATPGGAGTLANYDLTIADGKDGPFAYHIHEKPVPADGNCTGTGGHFDPFKPNGERGPCDKNSPGYCEIGDLSGKFAPVPQNTTGPAKLCAENIVDPWISLIPGNAADISGRSIVVHDSSKRRIACANLRSLW